MTNDSINMSAEGLEIVPDNNLNENNFNLGEIKMDTVTTIGKVSADNTTALLVALCDLAVATKQSLDDDGKITPADSIHYISSVIPVFNGVMGIQKIPAEFKDGFDDVEKQSMTAKVNEALKGLDANDIAATDAALDVVYALQKFFLVSGVIKKSV